MKCDQQDRLKTRVNQAVVRGDVFIGAPFINLSEHKGSSNVMTVGLSVQT